MRVLLAVFGLAALAASGLASADKVYKWTDAQGNVHYGDRPVKNSEAVEVRAPGGYSTPDPINPPPEGDAAPPEGAAPATSDARDATLCGQKKKQLEEYRKASRIVKKDAAGKEVDMSAEDTMRLIKQTEELVRVACAPTDRSAEDAPDLSAEGAREESR